MFQSAQGRLFYSCSVFVFTFFAGVHLISSCFYGISILRIVGLLVNIWFAIKTIDIIEERFGVPYTSVFWRKWLSLKESAKSFQNAPDSPLSPSSETQK